MTQFSRRSYPVGLPQVFYIACQKFTRLDAPSVLLFPQWTRTITTQHLILLEYFSRYPPINTQLKILFGLMTGLNLINISLFVVYKCATWRNNTNLSRQAVRPSWSPNDTSSCFKEIVRVLLPRKATLSSMVSITTRLMALPWAHL